VAANETMDKAFMSSTDQSSDISTDTLLGGQVTILQPRHGYRAAIDPLLLAASVKAEKGHQVLDVGSGTGAVALCLASRIAGLQMTGLDSDEGFCALARQSVEMNGLDIDIQHGDLFSLPSALRGNAFDHVVSNPPYWSPENNRPAAANKRGANFLNGVTLADWIKACMSLVVDRGVLSLIIPAERLDIAMGALAGKAGNLYILPLWPKQGVQAKRVILQATRSSRAGTHICAGLVLHNRNDSYTPEAQRVLHDGQALACL
jgi:tRNA1(Val) A37 N6-methylase TrmN6